MKTKIVFLFALLLTTLSDLVAQESTDSLDQSELEAVAEPSEAETLSNNEIWDRANTAYINESYDKAIELYNTILDSGQLSDKLYFNLGNAYFKKNKLGKAILNYEKALKISPTDSDIHYNLEVAKSRTKDRINEVPEFFLNEWNRAIQRLLSCTGWSIVSLIMLITLLGSLLIFLLSESIQHRKLGFGGGAISLFLLILTSYYAIMERHAMINHNTAVVMSQSLAVKSSPDNSSTDLFVLHEGTTLTIKRSYGDWSEVVIADGKKGWIETKRVEEI